MTGSQSPIETRELRKKSEIVETRVGKEKEPCGGRKNLRDVMYMKVLASPISDKGVGIQDPNKLSIEKEFMVEKENRNGLMGTDPRLETDPQERLNLTNVHSGPPTVSNQKPNLNSMEVDDSPQSYIGLEKSEVTDSQVKIQFGPKEGKWKRWALLGKIS
ncbi:hypothetical protein QYF36_016704 [Acer negundo]|nr:hypothetical protein QYF36_016704 [Acer negundo]